MYLAEYSILRFDFVPFDLQLNGDNVSITAAEYDIQFPLSEVVDIQLTDQAPQGTYYKNNGVNAQQYFLGNFKYKEYGQCKMYYYRDYTPVIKIKTDQYTVFFNTKDSEKRKIFIGCLRRLWKVGSTYYLYKRTSKKVPGKVYLHPVDTYIGIITPDGGFESKKQKLLLPQ